jgi:hypothetical protein
MPFFYFFYFGIHKTGPANVEMSLLLRKGGTNSLLVLWDV